MLSVAILAALQLTDLWTTHVVLKQGGRELNPLLAWCFAKFGMLPTLIPIKIIVVAMAYLYIPEAWVWGLAALYSVVIINNSRQIKT